MGNRGQATLKAVLATAFSVAATGTLLLDRGGLIGSAYAQNSDDKKRREQERHQPSRSQPPPPPRANVPPPSPQRLPERPVQQFQKPQPPAERPVQQFQRPPVPSEKPAQFQRPPSAEPYAPRPGGAPPSDFKKEGIQRLPPPSGQQGIAPPPGQGQPPRAFQRPPAVANPPPGPGGPSFGTPAPRAAAPPGAAFKRFEEVQKGRQVHVEDGGRRRVIEEPGKRFIVKENNRAIIRHDEAERFRRWPGAQSQHRPDGGTETFYMRRDGVRVVSVVDGNGRLLRRFRRDRDGREYNIIDNRRFYRNVAIGVGIGALGIVALNLARPHVTIPYDRYIVDYDRASDDDLYEALDAPPIEDLERPYSLEEVRYNYELRARMRSIDLDTIIFEFGAFEVPPDQYDKLERIARAILRVLQDNPEAVFLIEGHTDAVGSDEDNLSLSDRRAQSVAEILSETYEVPPENVVTQGYGEQYLKVNNQGPEPRNRRVSIRNITGLMAER